MLRLPKPSRPIHFAAFALAAFVWGLVGPVGWPITAAFVVTVFGWLWLARRSFAGESLLGTLNMISVMAFVLGAILMLAIIPAFLLRQQLWP
jgi:hypothetical protein